MRVGVQVDRNHPMWAWKMGLADDQEMKVVGSSDAECVWHTGEELGQGVRVGWGEVWPWGGHSGWKN